MNYILNQLNINLDAPSAWGIYFQDSATPQMEGLVELHDNIMYYLVVILFAVGWILLSIVRNYVATKSPISHKYLNHGKLNVLAQKCSNNQKYNKSLNSSLFQALPSYVYINLKVRAYSTSSPNNSTDEQFTPAAIYEDASSMKKVILKDNAGKSGIYMLTNKLTGDIYVGQSIDLRKRFLKYFNLSYLSCRNELRISRAILKYGYINFAVTILEYCDKCDLDAREQHYFDTLNPNYNIQKVAGGSSPPFPHKVGNVGVNNASRSSKRGNPVNIYEKCTSEGFKLIGSFVSARRAGKFLGISGSTILTYMKSGTVFKDRYKFSPK